MAENRTSADRGAVSAPAGSEDQVAEFALGDSNFVIVVAETRILPEEPPRTFEGSRPYFSKAE